MTIYKMVPLPGFESADPRGIKYSSSLHKNEREAQRMRLKRRSDPKFNARELERLYAYREKYPKIKKERSHPDDYLPRSHWYAILDAFSSRCAYCQGYFLLQKDHVVPHSKGGAMNIQNIVPACEDCNCAQGKWDKDLRDWLDDECLYEATLMSMGDAEYLVQ